MKKLILFTATLLIFQFSFSQWEFQNPVPSNAELNDVFFIDSSNGWAVGDYLTILYSNDGGQTWSEQLSAKEDSYYQFSNFYGVHFTDINHGWAIGQWYMPYGGGYYGLIFHTENGGTTWETLYPDSNSFNYCDIQFLNQSDGWLIDKAGKILHTENAGNSWVTQYHDTTKTLRSLSFIDLENGWIVGDDGLILHTDDGGNNWYELETGENINFNNVCFINEQLGWTGGSSDQFPSETKILKTADGGVTWEVNMDFHFPGEIGDMYFLDSENGWVTSHTVLGSWFLFNTSDAGETWSSYSVPLILNSLPSIFFIDQNTGWVVGENIIMKSVDGGMDWNAQNSVSNLSLKQIIFTDETHGWAVGNKAIPTFGTVQNENVIMHTNDGGNTWRSDSGGFHYTGPSWMESLSFTDSQHGWVAGVTDGHTGLMLKTIDGGFSWTWHDPPVYGTNPQIYFVDSLNGWITTSRFGKPPRYGCIYYSNDGGENWVEQLCEEDTYFNSLFFIDNQTGWIVGNDSIFSAMVFHTTDGGVNWQVQFSASDISLSSVHFSDQNHGWAVGNNNALLITSDGGGNWVSQDIDPQYTQLANVYFVDNEHGWILSLKDNNAAEGYAILSTIDGGETWTEQNSRPYGSLNSIHFTDELKGWASGEGGSILYTDNGGTVGFEEHFLSNPDLFLFNTYPNPFTTSTTIEYELNQPETVIITFYNQFGKQVDRIEQKQPTGKQQVVWAPELPGGVYFFRLEVGEHIASGKVVLVS